VSGGDNNVEKEEIQKTDTSLRLPRGGGLLQTGGPAEPVAVSVSREIGVTPRPTRPTLHRAGTQAGTRQADPRLNGLLAKLRDPSSRNLTSSLMKDLEERPTHDMKTKTSRQGVFSRLKVTQRALRHATILAEE
jgi:hypothetical protein